ncbi:hypothetical protein BKA70DRAFT_1246054 [Coprinopsis sp. MPI-PUGE-AT-0042]|nr:hypothetical protein BKA70DRAFT_1246054 [Coprinopsis sp. MPI-PUGE-AT-0042]
MTTCEQMLLTHLPFCAGVATMLQTSTSAPELRSSLGEFSTEPQPSVTPTTPKKEKLIVVIFKFVGMRRFTSGPTPLKCHILSERAAPPAALTISSPSTSTPRSRIKIHGRRSSSMAPQLVGPYTYTRRVSAPKIFNQSKPGHISCSSGDPKTHISLQQGAGLQAVALYGMESPEDVQNNNASGSGSSQAVETWDVYECADAVNLGLLLKQTRKNMVTFVSTLGANVLTEEQWQTTICGPKHNVYRVQIRYTAVPKRARKPDPGRPVALDQAKGIPGLMRILRVNGGH